MYMFCRKWLKVSIHPTGNDSAYRTYPRQVFWRQYWCNQGKCGNAAVPGTSNHGWGLAVDVPWFVKLLIDRAGAHFGWAKKWSDAPQEWWHYKWALGVWKNRPNPGHDYKNPVAKKGSGGRGQKWYVREIQRRLNKHGHKVKVDGDFGRSTDQAIRVFQQDAFGSKKAADGVVGAKTWSELRKRPKNGPKTPPKPKPKPIPPKKPVPKPKPVPGTIIDVSMHQGSIDWKKVKAQGIDGTYLKLSEGQDYRDPWAKHGRIRAVKNSGLPYGFYHFLRPKKRNPELEIDWFIKCANSLGGWGQLRPVLDIEQTELDQAGTREYVKRAVEYFQKKTGMTPIIYTYPSFWNDRVTSNTSFGCPLWIAHYGVSKPTIPKPWSSYIAWQYTSSGSVAGVNTKVDMNKVPNMNRIQRKN